MLVRSRMLAIGLRRYVASFGAPSSAMLGRNTLMVDYGQWRTRWEQVRSAAGCAADDSPTSTAAAGTEPSVPIMAQAHLASVRYRVALLDRRPCRHMISATQGKLAIPLRSSEATYQREGGIQLSRAPVCSGLRWTAIVLRSDSRMMWVRWREIHGNITHDAMPLIVGCISIRDPWSRDSVPRRAASYDRYELPGSGGEREASHPLRWSSDVGHGQELFPITKRRHATTYREEAQKSITMQP
ncbi:hypothetical protein DOTSEDRAFT_29813 [Dothistroma septosporum NZE10]|uniref:Uncharacterized protein n=1 Tax=Dothistroma septosporum (strain NZE10 / CBS 128990) TaxID=675120 RepID=N1Q133_DOTSN|nr:hypothetical protein DOTSEDRAFT_29813 [Dothistroma septosporum NZE10]